MRVLQINSVYRSGSTGKIAYDIHEHLRGKGYASAIAYGRGNLSDDTAAYRFAPTWEVYAHAALTRATGRTGCFSPFATGRLLRFIDKFNPDVMHIHELHAYFVNVAPVMEYVKKKNIKTVWTFHCEFMYTGKCGYAFGCEAWKKECGHCPNVKDYPSSLMFDQTRSMFRQKKRLFDGFDRLTIAVPSEWLANRVRQSFLNGKKIKVVTNGNDTDVFRPRDASALRERYGAGKTVVHVTGSFEDKRKGGRYVLELAKRMPYVKFFIVGNGAHIPNLPPNAVAVGRTENQTELAEWYSFADLSVIASERENFPTVCLESLCCGTPVAGFVGGGTAETAPGGYGEFVPYADMDALEKAVRHALDGGLKSKEDCAQFGRARYAKEAMAQRYMELYKS
jgi:glycosyltransferase involved in cell wall biosynthesis